MAKSERGARGERGITGLRGRSGKRGRKGVGKTGPKGTPGIRGTTGKTGVTGARGKVGSHGPSGTLAGSEHEAILIVQRRIEDIYEGLTVQMQRTAQIQVEMDSLRAKLQALMHALR